MKKFNLQAIQSIEESTTQSDTTLTVDIDKLSPNPYQPRFKEEVSELAQNIAKHGLLQPITINQDNVIVAGHRRYYAHIELGHKTIKANMIICDDKQLHIYALIENIQREQLHPIELAFSYDQAIKEGLFTSAKELAASIDKPESHVTKVRNMLKLPDHIVEHIRKTKVKISIETVSLLIQFDHDTLTPIFNDYIAGKINRTDIKQRLDLYKHNALEPKDPVKKSKKTIQVSFKLDNLNDTQKEELEKEIETLLKKYQTT